MLIILINFNFLVLMKPIVHSEGRGRQIMIINSLLLCNVEFQFRLTASYKLFAGMLIRYSRIYGSRINRKRVKKNSKRGP